jgi:demethylmenaquinone methyltransferase/2-methoxy-6-polyprenyl-1,4-benzoquinol methylase
MDSDDKLDLVHRFFAGTGLTYDSMVHWATFGIDGRWKRRLVQYIPPLSRRVLDLACGTGISTLAIAARYPHCHVVGVELRDEYLKLAQQKIEALRIENVELVLARAEDYWSDKPFDCVTSSYLAKYADLPGLIRRAQQLLKDGGILLMHDFTYPPQAALGVIWRVYFWVLQRAAAPLFPAWREIFYGLPQLIEKTRWVTECTALLHEHGFHDVKVEYLTLYGSAIVSAKKTRAAAATPVKLARGE